ncbi:Acid_phosphatase [Hexamita inflata]|uniref:Acid phosphatase n=1 Tax=Hexamita inflata TaxID=28002 RepID=A0AA86UBZ4_9EUKA|nr:Acid phosphatase [Hexamita inflata]
MYHFCISLCISPSQVIIVTRHGIRSSLYPYPNDTAFWSCSKSNLINFQSNTTTSPITSLNLRFDVKNMVPGSCYKGQLADQGFSQHQHLNTIWSSLYPSLFTPTNQRSTNKHRTRLSLLGQLNSNQIIHVSTWTMDSAFLAENCDSDHKFWAVIQNGYDFQAEKLNQLQQKTNWSVWWNFFADNFRARAAMGVEVPGVVSNEDLDLVNQMQDKFWCYVYQRHQNVEELTKYQKMAIGPFLQDLKDYINIMRACKRSARFQTSSSTSKSTSSRCKKEWNCVTPLFDTVKIVYDMERIYLKKQSNIQ